MKTEYLKPNCKFLNLRIQSSILKISFDPDDDTEKWEIEDEEDL